MLLLYLDGERENRLIVGAANRSEASIGFFVKHGCDHANDIMPIGDLYKTQVRQLARYLGVPSRIVEKAPTPDLIRGLSDEQAIGISYEDLDMILLAMEKGWKDRGTAAALGVEGEKVAYVRSLTKDSEHMRNVYVCRGWKTDAGRTREHPETLEEMADTIP